MELIFRITISLLAIFYMFYQIHEYKKYERKEKEIIKKFEEERVNLGLPRYIEEEYNGKRD